MYVAVTVQHMVFHPILYIHHHSRANNVPYGEFALGQASIVVETMPEVSRSIVVNVLRELGTFGTVRCTVAVAYSEVGACDSM